MAFHVQTFLTRLGSAAVFSAIMLLGLLFNEWAFIALFFLINILCLREYASMVELILQTKFNKNEKINFMVLGIALFALVISLPLAACHNSVIDILAELRYYLLGIVIGITAIFFVFQKNKQSIYLLTGLGYISLALGLLVQVRYQSLLLPLLLILFIWMNDSMAYLTGSFIGRTKFFPSISPKKTIEGTLGGIAFTLVFAFVWASYTHWFPVSVWIAFALIASIVGTLGDLVESKLKRLAGIKDSGNIMPGHGGALDRFDSLLLASPFAFLAVLILEVCKKVSVF
ncbi:MAG: phosphatidate cytidylyltransferase [Bacteroidetes bacterium]|nr:phosphatidate cytidylyltransferase [Bacteroidota bacterium]